MKLSLTKAQVHWLLNEASIKVEIMYDEYNQAIQQEARLGEAIEGDAEGIWAEFELVNEIITDLTVTAGESESTSPGYQLARTRYHQLCDEIYEIDMHKIRKDGKPPSNPDGMMKE